MLHQYLSAMGLSAPGGQLKSIAETLDVMSSGLRRRTDHIFYVNPAIPPDNQLSLIKTIFLEQIIKKCIESLSIM